MDELTTPEGFLLRPWEPADASAVLRAFAPAGVRALARWAFDELGLYRLELGHRTDNPASCRVATRSGFAPEGIERARLRYGALRYDVERHARLADDDVNFD